MFVSSLHEYGLRCAVQLAKVPTGETLSASQIAEKEKLSVEYVSKIMLLMRKGELVESTRGKKGGFRFIRHPQEILIRDVLRSLKADNRPEDILGFCQSFGGTENTSEPSDCVHSTCCSIRPIWDHLFRSYEELIGAITLADLSLGSHVVQEKLNQIRFVEKSKQYKKELGVPLNV